tara:strand:+ start:9122 stop:10579 length:1458 start_codon:yes stop_codon:yes gene_type:complete
MSNIITDSTFAEANNNDTFISGNAWGFNQLFVQNSLINNVGTVAGVYPNFVFNNLQDSDETIIGFFDGDIFQGYHAVSLIGLGNRANIYLTGVNGVQTVNLKCAQTLSLTNENPHRFTASLETSHFGNSYPLNTTYLVITLIPTGGSTGFASAYTLEQSIEITNLNSGTVSTDIDFNFYLPSNSVVTGTVTYSLFIRFSTTPSWMNPVITEDQGSSGAFRGVVTPANYTQLKHSFSSIGIFDISTGAVAVIHDLEQGADFPVSNSVINFTIEPIEAVNTVTDNTIEVMYTYPAGWSIMSCPLDILTLQKNFGANPTELSRTTDTTFDVVDFLRNHLYEFPEDTQPLYYKSGDTAFKNVLQMFKNNAAEVFFVEFDFNGIGNYVQMEGYQMRTSVPVTFKYKGDKLFDPEYGGSSDVGINFLDGWNIIAYPCLEPFDAVQWFGEMTNNNQLQIVKNYSAEVYWPEYYFNGIGDLQPGEGYQVRANI